MSTSLLGALGGSLAALAAGNRVGRRTELMAAAALYAAGAAGAGAAPGLAPLLAARLAYGAGIGLAMHAAPAYIAETSPPNVRGLLISLKEAAIGERDRETSCGTGGLGVLSMFLFVARAHSTHAHYTPTHTHTTITHCIYTTA